MTIQVASINPPDRSRPDLPAVEAAEADVTFYIKAGGNLSLLARVLRIAITHPSVFWRGTRAALQLGAWDLKSRAYAAFYLAEALLVGDWMRRQQLTHLHVHFGGAVATVGMLTSQAWQIPWSVTLHGPDEFFDQDAFYLRQKIESASFVICISDFCRSQVLRVAPSVVDSRLEIVRLGVDCEALQPADRHKSSHAVAIENPAFPFHIVCTGRMVAAKGHRILIEALAALIESGVSLTCTLIGDGPERPVLEEQCRRLGIASDVRFLGAQAHGPTVEEVARADVFVLASFAEGLPVALMEAMALGIPCVSTTIAAIPELIHDQQNGLLVPPANVDALREALARLAADPELRRRLAIQARITAESQYNISQNLDKLALVWVRRVLA
jgi:colanic acid/amylovoran biosynthesis glycosyltransferase